MTIKKIIADLKKYWEYITFAATSELKSEVAGSFLGWIWWILDPLFFMFVYTFVVRFVFAHIKINFFFGEFFEIDFCGNNKILLPHTILTP